MTDEPDRSGAKARRDGNGRFLPGASGNPAGMPKGTKHKIHRAIEDLLDGSAERITQKALDLALEGDTTALKIVMDRLVPPRKDAPILIDLPRIEKASDVVGAQAAITAAVAAGELTPSEAAPLSQLVERVGSAIELRNLEERIEALESSRGGHQQRSGNQNG